MAHYAQVEKTTGIVLQVLVMSNNFEDAKGQPACIKWLEDTVDASTDWIKTSYNAHSNGFRKKFAGIGDKFDSNKNKLT